MTNAFWKAQLSIMLYKNDLYEDEKYNSFICMYVKYQTKVQIVYKASRRGGIRLHQFNLIMKN